MLLFWVALFLVASAEYEYTNRYASVRSDYYLRQAALAPAESYACTRHLEAAIDISPDNLTVQDRVSKILQQKGCKEPMGKLGDSSFSIGPMDSWESRTPGKDCATPAGARSKELFATPLGFLHVSDLGLTDWKQTLDYFKKESVRRFKQLMKQKRKEGGDDAKFIHLNNHFFKTQRTDPREAMAHPQDWPKLYGSPQYREYSQKMQTICSSYIKKMGISLSEHEEKNMEVVLWGAIYPNLKGEPVTHYYHAHQESIVSFVMYTATPEPATPIMMADPRGAPPVEDFEWFQGAGDMGVDGQPPFHRSLEFFPADGDIFIFPSFAIHKVPPYIGNGTRVAWPCNCHLQRKATSGGGTENPLDGWERIARWPASTGARPAAVSAYYEHAKRVMEETLRVDDPYMKLWEAQNAVVAMLQFGPNDAQTWIDAGNVSMHLAMVLASRQEGDYFDDALTFFKRGVNLDSSGLGTLSLLLKSMRPKKTSHKHLKRGWKEAEPFIKKMRSWKTPPAEDEFKAFLHSEINGPGKCNLMCPGLKPPVLDKMKIVPTFGTRVYTFPITPRGGDPTEDIVKASRQLLGDVDAQVSFISVPDGAWWWDEGASLTGIFCESQSTIWFADPRGHWPERWPGCIPFSPGLNSGTALGAEPKAPFHWHATVTCSANEIVLFPSWLKHQMGTSDGGTKTFIVSVTMADRLAGWRVPLPDIGCKHSFHLKDNIKLHSNEL